MKFGKYIFMCVVVS